MIFFFQTTRAGFQFKETEQCVCDIAYAGELGMNTSTRHKLNTSPARPRRMSASEAHVKVLELGHDLTHALRGRCTQVIYSRSTHSSLIIGSSAETLDTVLYSVSLTSCYC